MTEDWAAVATAIDQRVRELGWRQRELAERSHVSQAIVRELQHNAVQRRRSARTLEALSLALEWHPRHLRAVLHGQQPPRRDQKESDTEDAVYARLDTIEKRLFEVTSQLEAMNARLERALGEPGNRDSGRSV